MAEQRNAAMPDIPIHNETEYSLTASMLDQIKRDAMEYFGESVHSIRVQYGIERHAFNAKTGEVRYAFSPGDYGLIDTSSFAESLSRSAILPSIDDDQEDLADEPFDDEEVDIEAEETVAFGSLDEEIDTVEDDEHANFQSLDADFEPIEDEENDFLYDDEDDYD
jgi:hypothetical protein